MIAVGRELVNKHAERMAILLSCSSVMRLTVLTKRSCAYTMYVHSGGYDNWHGAAYKHVLSKKFMD